MTVCTYCNGIGDLHGMGFYDCTNCGAADQRVALNAAIAALPPMIGEDIAWVAYQAGVASAEKRHAEDIAELVVQLRKMWGHAIELKHLPGYFDEGSEEGREAMQEWRRECNDAYAVVRKHREKPCKS